MSSAPAHAPLVVETRGIGSAQSVESVHYGSVAVVDSTGRLLAWCGDPQALTFTRSTLKPFQAVPFVEAGGLEAFGYGSAETAMLCASHSGEPVHVQWVQSMLERAECSEHDLQCGCHVPLGYTYHDRQPPAGATFDQRFNNCSGKHSGFLSWCRLADAPIERYLDDGHPLQRAIRSTTARLAGLDEATLAVGIDGCSAPNFALPLDRVARLYALLARPDAAPEANQSLATLSAAMRRHPELISGTGRSDLNFVGAFASADGDSDLVVKIGAGGVQAFGFRSSGIGVAIKIADGQMPALYCAAHAVLEQLGVLDDKARASLAQYARPLFRNYRDLPTGELRPVLALNMA
ncbi:asparaginase [soil metagenome]